MKVLVNNIWESKFKEGVNTITVKVGVCDRISKLMIMNDEERGEYTSLCYSVEEIIEDYESFSPSIERRPEELCYIEIIYTVEDDQYVECYITNSFIDLRKEIDTAMKHEFLIIDEYNGIKYKIYNAHGEVISEK